MSTIEHPSAEEFPEPKPDVRYLPADDVGRTVEALRVEDGTVDRD